MTYTLTKIKKSLTNIETLAIHPFLCGIQIFYGIISKPDISLSSKFCILSCRIQIFPEFTSKPLTGLYLLILLPLQIKEQSCGNVLQYLVLWTKLSNKIQNSGTFALSCEIQIFSWISWKSDINLYSKFTCLFHAMLYNDSRVGIVSTIRFYFEHNHERKFWNFETNFEASAILFDIRIFSGIITKQVF